MVECYKATASNIKAAAQAIRQGKLVAFGTETVYGLGGDATNSEAVAKIYGAKNRPAFNPLISHVDSSQKAFELGKETPIAQQLAHAFWPGAMTLVLKQTKASRVCTLATSGLDSIAVRVPSKPAALDFLAQCGCPVAAPSANKSGRTSPTRASHVQDELGDVQDLYILDMGAAEHGLESTVIDARGTIPIILRFGTITPDMIAAATNQVPIFAEQNTIISPGQLQSHYAPSKPLVLNVTSAEADDIYIGFGVHGGDFNLSPSGDLTEAAACLYHLMRQADEAKGKRIVIAPIPEESLGIAINDRLNRAAAPRPSKD